MNNTSATVTFERYENKYLLTGAQYKTLMAAAGGHLAADEYGRETICSLYFDTEDFRMIRASLEKPVYKEKLRLRSYGVPSAGSEVFVELKKKYKGIVYKRRVVMSYREAYNYLIKGVRPETDSQILREIDWAMEFYSPVPIMNISYCRESFYDKDDLTVRLTLDNEVLWRTDSLGLERGAFGEALLAEGERLMEIKTAGAIPLWLCRALGEAEIYPASFSKYGNAYRAFARRDKRVMEVFRCA